MDRFTLLDYRDGLLLLGTPEGECTVVMPIVPLRMITQCRRPVLTQPYARCWVEVLLPSAPIRWAEGLPTPTKWITHEHRFRQIGWGWDEEQRRARQRRGEPAATYFRPVAYSPVSQSWAVCD